MGLAVTNTRDEPTGAIPNFASGGRSTPATPGGSSDGGLGGGILAASTGLYFLSSAFSTAEGGIGKFISEIAFAASALTSLTLLKGPVEKIGAKLSSFGVELATYRSPKTGNPMKYSEGKLVGAKGKLGRGIAGVGGALPGIGTAVAIGTVLAPLVLELTKTKTGFEKLNEELKNIDLGELSSGSKEASSALRSAFVADLKAAQKQAELKEKLGIEEDKKKSIEDLLEEQLGGLTGINKGFFGGIKDKSTLSASLAKVGDKNALQDIVNASQKDVKIRTGTGIQIKTETVKQFDADLFAENMIKAIDLIDAAAEKAADTALKVAAGFGEGAFTGGKAKKDFKDRLGQGRFAAGGFDTTKQLESTKTGQIETIFQSGALSEIRNKELDLAEAATTIRKVGLENEIALKKFLVEKAKEEFRITEDYVKSIRDATIFSEEQKEFIEGQVEAGSSLLLIEKGLVEAGIELTKDAKIDFDLAVEKALIQEKILDNKLEEVKLQQKINDLSKPQGFGGGIRKGLGNLENDIAFFRDELGENIPAQFSSNLGSALQEAVSQAKTLDEALSDAGRNFLGFIKDAFLQQAADQATSALFGSSEGKGGLFGGESAESDGGILGGVKSLFGGKSGGSAGSDGGILGGAKSLFGGESGGSSPDGTAGNPIYTVSSASAANPVDALAGGEKGEGIFSKLETTFGGLFGKLKDGLGTIFKGLTTNLGSLFSGGSGGGGGGIGGIAKMALSAFGFGFANGGPVGFANGGSVGPTDTIPAMLTPGEFVMKKSAVEKYGSGFLSSINEGVMPMRGFQNGGVVSPVSAEAGTASNSASQVTNTSDFTFNIQGGKAEQAGEKGNDDQQRDFAQKVKAAVTTVVQEESRTGGTLNYLYKK